MPRIDSRIDRDSDEFQKNYEANAALAAELAEVRARVSTGGSARAREKHLSRGKLLPRDRINALIDEDSAFLEIGQFAALDVYPDDVPAVSE